MRPEQFAYRLALVLKKEQLEEVDAIIQQGDILWVQTTSKEVLRIEIESVSKGEFEREAKEFYKVCK